MMWLISPRLSGMSSTPTTILLRLFAADATDGSAIGGSRLSDVDRREIGADGVAGGVGDLTESAREILRRLRLAAVACFLELTRKARELHRADAACRADEVMGMQADLGKVVSLRQLHDLADPVARGIEPRGKKILEVLARHDFLELADLRMIEDGAALGRHRARCPRRWRRTLGAPAFDDRQELFPVERLRQEVVHAGSE